MRPFLLSLFFVSFCITLSGQITKYPLLAHSTADDIRIIEVANVQKDHLNRHVTLITMEYSPRQEERFMIPPGMYINDADNPKRRYELIEFANDTHYIGKWYPGEKNKVYRFTIVFQGIDACVSKINIYEPEIMNTVTWLWKDIMINNYCNGKVNNPIADRFAPIISNPAEPFQQPNLVKPVIKSVTKSTTKAAVKKKTSTTVMGW